MRQITNINDGWKFAKSDVGANEAVNAAGENVNSAPHLEQRRRTGRRRRLFPR